MNDWVTPPPKLSDEDRQRVEDYLHSGYNTVERRPFRPGLMVLLVLAVVTSFSGLSWLIAWYYGVL